MPLKAPLSSVNEPPPTTDSIAPTLALSCKALKQPHWTGSNSTKTSSSTPSRPVPLTESQYNQIATSRVQALETSQPPATELCRQLRSLQPPCKWRNWRHRTQTPEPSRGQPHTITNRPRYPARYPTGHRKSSTSANLSRTTHPDRHDHGTV